MKLIVMGMLDHLCGRSGIWTRTPGVTCSPTTRTGPPLFSTRSSGHKPRYTGAHMIRGRTTWEWNVFRCHVHSPLLQSCYGVIPSPPPSTPKPSPPPPAECSYCQDVAPDSTYTCAQQKGWGKCSESWMQGYCKKACGQCSC